MLIFDFFAGTGSSTQAFKDAGHTVITFELDPQFDVTETVSILDLVSSDLLARYGRPDFIWASPPCTAFSVASIGHHWLQGGANPIPKTPEASYNQELVRYTIRLIEELQPTKGYLIENPRGMLRKLPVVANLPRQTITYCQYGEERMKPTDLWGVVPGWTPRLACKNGMTCHVAAPRGSVTGTQGIKGARDRSMIPYELSKELLEAIGDK
jgi:C-5 cytosine-specific DNA methylase